MAETTNNANTTPKKKGPNPVLEGVSSFLKVFTWLAVGFVFLFVGVICKIKRPIPASWEPFFTHHIPHLPYFICGLGFLCLAYARQMMRQVYVKEQKNDFFYPHRWKVSLLGTQVFLLTVSGLYAILYGCNVVPPIGIYGLVIFISCFLLYLVWYQIEYFKNRLPSLAALRIALLSFVFAGLAYILWSGFQMIIPSLILAFLAVFAGIYSLSYRSTVAQRFVWLQSLIMIVSVGLLAAIGYYVLAFWNPQLEPLNTVVVAQGLRGDINNLNYLPQGDKISFTQKFQDKWTLQVIDPKDKAPVTIKLVDVDGPFETISIDENTVLIDPVKEDTRELLKVDLATGAQTTLINEALEPFSGGSPWSKDAQSFLFVTKDKKGFHLNSWTEGKKPAVLFDSPASILSPAWVGEQVAFVDGVHATPFLLNLKTKNAIPLITEEENKDTSELVETDPLVEVIPSPDNFRYLCVGLKGGQTTLWTMLMDTSKKVELYKTSDKLSSIKWLTDGQKIVFERQGQQLGFNHSTSGVVLLDANLRTTVSLIPSQVNVHSPVPSPDGIKIAFVGSEGLWYPSLDSGVWVTVLR